ncbi:MAG: MarR family transcriptional regulator, partial [SAR116 cluster bacterium MED-G04]
MDNRSKANLDLIVALENNQQVSQTKLAKRIGIAAGLVNILLKRAVNRGFVKMTQIPARRYAYYLTPQGFAEKAKLVGKYLNSSLSLYRRLRVEYRDLFASLEARGISEVTLVGDTDIAEIAIMASF